MLEVNWFLPTNGDGRHLTSSGLPGSGRQIPGERLPSLDYLRQVVRATDRAGFDAILIPTASGFEDPWLIAAALAADARRLKFLVTVRPGLELPSYTAYKAATLQQLTDNRLWIHVVSGSSPFEQRSLGDFLGHDARYQRTEEFLRVFHGLWKDYRQPFHGEFYRSGGAALPMPDVPSPRVYFGGASAAAEQVAARQAEVYMMWGEPPDMLAERIAHLRGLAAAQGRQLRFGLRLHVFAEASAEQAWNRVGQLVREIPESVIEQARKHMDSYESVGQSRQTALTRGRQAGARELEVSPNLWAGVGLVRGGAGTALVGSYDEVAERIEEYRQLGVDSFTLSGFPHLEEAIHLGRELLPRLKSPCPEV